MTQETGRRLTWREALSVLLFFTLVSVAFTWPLVTHLNDTLPEWADAADSSWRIGSIAQQLRTDPLHLYQTRAFYPVANGLALDELLTGQAILAAPIIWLTGNLPLAFNLLNLLSYIGSGFAMWLLVRYLTGSSGAGLVAGLIFCISPWYYELYQHLGLNAQFWMVFALYFLIRFLRGTATPSPPGRGQWVNAGLFGFFALLQALVAGYYSYFEAILFGLFLVYYALFEAGVGRWLWQRLRGRRDAVSNAPPHWRRLVWQFGTLAVVGLAALVILLPFVWPFVQAQRQFGFSRSLDETSYWSASATSLLPTERSLLYKPLLAGLPSIESSTGRTLFPGVIALGLAIFGLVVGPRRSSGDRWFFAVVALTGLILSFGPVLNLAKYRADSTGIMLPYMWLYQHVPGFDALRVPARFGQLFMLGLAVCAGYGVAALLERRPNIRTWQVGIVSGVLALVALEYWAPGLPTVYTPTGEQAPAVYKWLAGPEAARLIPPDALLLELPVGTTSPPVNTNPIYLMYGLMHNHRMLNGSSNIIPPGYDRLYSEMRRFPTPWTLDIAQGLGVQVILVHTGGLLSDEKRAALAQESGPGGRLQQLAAFPDIGDNPASQAIVYKLKPSSQNVAALAAAIPEGAEVLLADHPGHQRLYTAVLPALLGNKRKYFTTYHTVYDAITGNVQPAQPGRTYPYAVFYRDTDPLPSQYGYTPQDLVNIGNNELIQLYHKQTAP